MSKFFNDTMQGLLEASAMRYKSMQGEGKSRYISDYLMIGVDFSTHDEGALVVMRRVEDDTYVLNQFRNEEARELYNKLIGVKEIPYEAEWKYWDGWMSNHDKRIDDATCSKCGYEHTIVKGSPELLSDYCPNCNSKMKKS